MLISIVVPVYKVEPYLRTCIDSILAQQLETFELILVDDGSPDRCGEICEEYAAIDPRIRVIHRKNGGLSAARNTGIDAARGDYLSFIDSDDYILPGYLSSLYALLQSAEGCKVSQVNHYVVRGGRHLPNAPIAEDAVFLRRDAFEAVLYHDRVDVSAWGKLFHRSVFDDLRFPEGRTFEDTYLFGEILQKTPCLVYGGQPQYCYVQRADSIVNRSFSERNLQFIEAVERLAAFAIQEDPELEAACVRRRVHARLSVLRYMKRCPAEYRSVRDALRQEALENASRVLLSPRTPRRDRIALRLLRMGYTPFYLGWDLYSIMR